MVQPCKQFTQWLSLLAMTLSLAPASAADPSKQLDFTRDVRPILSDACFHCHGPDASHREADLRLDVWQSAGDIHGAEQVIDRKSPDKSELVARILSDDPDVRMPPPDSHKVLKPEQIEILKQWVLQGGTYRTHWAFVAPQRPDVPDVAHKTCVRNPIDAFVLARLEREGLEPSAAASANTLLRRLSLDLIGLPP